MSFAAAGQADGHVLLELSEKQSAYKDKKMDGAWLPCVAR
jgi:hypothetical protein